jgi:signal transduction histidine kinase
MRHLKTFAILLLAWGLLAAWQWHECGHERDLIRGTLVLQAESVMKALVSGIRSHRWLGPFFREQLPGTLEELVNSEAILAAALLPQTNSADQLNAGAVELLDEDPPVGGHWRQAGYQLAVEFELGADTRGGMGGGPGAGRRGRREFGAIGDARDLDTLILASRYKAVLLFDSSGVESQCRQSAWNRGLIVLSGGLVLLCVAWAWRVQVRLVEAHGRTQILESEARHLRELSQAAAGLAHETRNPLGLIRGWTQRLADPDSPLDEHQLDAVLEECDRITARINQFLAFARSRDPVLERVDLGKLIDQLRMLLEPDLEAKGLGIDRRQVREGQTLQADAEMLRQALFNLMQNAIHFAPEGSVVEIALSADRGPVFRLAVTDRGPGVAGDDVKSLFTPYFTTRADGTGLGLAIVRRIAVSHGWQTGYTPHPGGGACFWMSGIHG